MDNKKQLQPINDLSALNAISGGGGYKGSGPRKQQLVIVEPPATLVNNVDGRNQG
ncbi:hypothetical protein SG34_020145 [Thalassomonas viridans]|uniref:Uncharacterized protein n=1 Tax=Thalassomonas viridans TaxID=137584 RepID=A0AAF0C7Z4_9GAMM|nr:hypothetical protein [Thalassomonas viridans]WDE03675.1 hypothetical protein SG34_020145 [Thalassomonas viridans]